MGVSKDRGSDATSVLNQLTELTEIDIPPRYQFFELGQINMNMPRAIPSSYNYEAVACSHSFLSMLNSATPYAFSVSRPGNILHHNARKLARHSISQ